MGEDQYDQQIPEYLMSSICRINAPNKYVVFGFLINLLIKQNNFFGLITNSKFITENMVNTNQQIKINYDNGKKKKIINLNIRERYIEFFHDTETLIIQIINGDNIDTKYFLSIDRNSPVFTGGYLKNQAISLFSSIDNLSLDFVIGKIVEVNNNEFIYEINDKNIKRTLIGTPIFFKNKSEVIGIAKGTNENISGKNANLLGPIYKYFEEKFEIENSQDGVYYFGHLKNDTPNGHGYYRFKNGEIYDGDIINDKFEGKGKYIYTNGEYYIGQWKNNLRHGKGILYYSNHKVKYDGDFKEDKYEGNGKYFYENGEYYLGQFKNNYNDGKGIIYYSNGNIKYEGYFVNDKFEGEGKYVYEDGVYYMGHFKNGLKHGKGKLFNRDGNIIYEGIFNNGN